MGNKTNHKGKTTKKPIAKVIHQNDPNSVSKGDVGLKNWWDFNYEGKCGISPSNRTYINDIAFDVLMNALRRGYSAKGMILSLALSAQESGYGNSKALANSYAENNFWGIKIPNTKFNKKYNSKKEGEDAGLNLFETDSRYLRLKNLLRQDNPSLSGLDSGLHDFDPKERPKYATYLHDSLIEGIAVRTLAIIPGKLQDIQNEIDEAEEQTPKGVPFLPKSFPSSFGLRDKEMLNENVIKELKAEKNDLLHIKQELETGKADTNYFLQPKTNGLLKKEANMPYPTNIGIPDWKTGGYSDTTEMEPPIKQNIAIPFTTNRVGGADNSANMIKPTPYDSLPSSSQINPSSSLGGNKNRGRAGNTPVNNISHQPNYTINNLSTTSANKVYDQIVEVLTSAVADSRIGTDAH
jgi:hypothetical protein